MRRLSVDAEIVLYGMHTSLSLCHRLSLSLPTSLNDDNMCVSHSIPWAPTDSTPRLSLSLSLCLSLCKTASLHSAPLCVSAGSGVVVAVGKRTPRLPA